MKTPCQDTYFLDPDLAYQTALAHNTVVLETGEKLEQFCYYDGEPFNYAPSNLINVPADDFVNYFQDHRERMPKYIDFTAARRRHNVENLKQRYYRLLSTIQQMRNK
ncbi:MAG: hypothetical protein PVF34_07230 [Gammaproteobacteria bacterium]|jgi:hypothetical protein